MERLLIVGAGGYARSVAEAAEATGRFELVGFLDDRWPDVEPIWGYPILGTTRDLQRQSAHADAAVVAIGDNVRRSALCQAVLACGMRLASVIHPHAVVSTRAKIGAGVTVMAGAVIACDARLGDGALVNAGGIIDHQAELEPYAHLGTGACLAGGAVLAAGGRLPTGATLGPGERSASNATATPHET